MALRRRSPALPGDLADTDLADTDLADTDLADEQSDGPLADPATEAACDARGAPEGTAPSDDHRGAATASPPIDPEEACEVTLAGPRRSERPMPAEARNRNPEVSDLVAAAREGDRDAFDELVRATYADSYTLAYRLTGDDDDARDVVQEAYLRAFRGLRRFRGDAQFSTWMYRITANCAATYLGKRNRHRHEALSDDDVIADDRLTSDPDRSSQNVELRGELQRSLLGLPPKLRTVVVLRDVYDLPHEAIAAELGISVSAAKVRLHRARRKLREDLHPLPHEEREARAG